MVEGKLELIHMSHMVMMRMTSLLVGKITKPFRESQQASMLPS